MLKNSPKVSEYELPIKIERQKNGGFLAASTSWKDCYAQGDTIDEAILEITAVAQSLIELYKAEDLEIPLKKVRSDKLMDDLAVPIIVAA